MESKFTNNKDILIDLTFVNGLPKNTFDKLAVKLKPYVDEGNENEIKK